MKDYILQRKIARIVALIAKRQGISQQQALVDFYRSRTCAMLHNPATAMHLMSDAYVADDYLGAAKDRQRKN